MISVESLCAQAGPVQANAQDGEHKAPTASHQLQTANRKPAALTPQMPEFALPMGWQSHHLHVGEFDHHQHLPTGD